MADKLCVDFDQCSKIAILLDKDFAFTEQYIEAMHGICSGCAKKEKPTKEKSKKLVKV